MLSNMRKAVQMNQWKPTSAKYQDPIAWMSNVTGKVYVACVGVDGKTYQMELDSPGGQRSSSVGALTTGAPDMATEGSAVPSRGTLESEHVSEKRTSLKDATLAELEHAVSGDKPLTPRTDEQVTTWNGDWVSADFARQLERELAEAKDDFRIMKEGRDHEHRKRLKASASAERDAVPVAWANWKVGSKGYIPFRTSEEAAASVQRSEISATQLGPYEVVPLYVRPASSVRDAIPYWPRTYEEAQGDFTFRELWEAGERLRAALNGGAASATRPTVETRCRKCGGCLAPGFPASCDCVGSSDSTGTP